MQPGNGFSTWTADNAEASGLPTAEGESALPVVQPGIVNPLEEVANDTLQELNETLQHVESVGRPHDIWWTLNNRRRAMAERVFGLEACATLDAFLTSKPWLLFTVIMTLFCLYAVDVCDVASCAVQARTVISGLLLAVFVVFSLEVLASSVFVDRYFLSFFFWVDLIGTASLIFDIHWIADSILSEADSNSLQITRAGRAARLGSQIGRITRVLRVFRLFRALRLLKVLQLRRRAQAGMAPHGLGDGPIRPTVLGELLAESTTRKCVIIILIVLIIATFLETTPPDVADYNRLQLLSYRVMSPEAFVLHAAYPVIALSYVDVPSGGLVQYLPYTRGGMRPRMQLRTRMECARYEGPELDACGFAEDWSTVWYDVSRAVRLNAALNIVLTTVIIVCLGLSAYFFGKDATTYVIMPIETMLRYLRRMIRVGGDGDVESEGMAFAKPPETDVLANYVSRLVYEINNARCQAEEEALISDTLLCSMVPPRIALQLKELRWWEAGPEQRARTIADSFPHTTVLFTDLVGFTTLSSRISAEDAMRHLNNMYTVFDEIVERHGLYKVETIGDSYMLVGGAPEERSDHAERVARAALEMRACVPLLQEISGEPEINVRIGMHSGAVTAGVVGFKNPRWHLFGDTCNTASRMESTGMAGEIQLSCTTYELIKDHFSCKLRGKIAVKGKGEMVTYLLEREYGGPNKRPDSPTGHGSQYPSGSGTTGPLGGGTLDREAFLATPQFKKAVERYTTARNSALHEEEELVKLLKSLDEATAAAAAAAAGLAGTAGGVAGGVASGSSAAEAVTAAGCIVPRLAAGLGGAPFKSLVLGEGASPSDVKALAIHLHEELGVARALLGSAEEERAAAGRRELLLRLYGRVLEAPGMSLRDTFTAILDTLYKVIECDVIKLYVVDHARNQLWPASRHTAADASRTLPLDGTLAGSAVQRACTVRVDDVAAAPEFNADLEELPAGYVSKSMMCVPVFSTVHMHATALRHLRLAGAGAATSGPDDDASCDEGGGGAAPAPGDVMAVIVLVNRWTPWGEAGAEEGERCIVPFSQADEASLRDAAGSVGLLLQRRRGEMLLAAAASAAAAAAAGLGGAGGLGFSVAALPASVARQRLRTVARRGSGVLLDLRGNLWAMKQEELMGQARDVLAALQRHCSPGPGTLTAANGGGSWWSWLGDEVLVSYLVRIAGEQSGGTYFNLAHSVGVMQGIYLTLRSHPELAAALGPTALLSLVLAASLLNVMREGDAISAGAGQPPPVGALGGSGAVSGAHRGSRGRVSGANVSLATSTSVGGSFAAGAAGSGSGPPLPQSGRGAAASTHPQPRVPNGGSQHQQQHHHPQQLPSAGSVGAPAPGAASGAGPGSAPAPSANPPPTATHSHRGRGWSVRRCRLAAVVDDILIRESNLLGGLPQADAAAVKAGVVSLLALRNQPSTVLGMAGLQPAKLEALAAAGVVSVTLPLAPSAGTGSTTAPVADGSVGGSRAEGIAAGGEGEGSTGVSGAANTVQADDVAMAVADAAAPETAAVAAAGADDDDSPSQALRRTSTLSLQGLLRAAGSDPTALAEARMAVSALLLLTWSELLHVKDTPTALSLLWCRAQDANAWATRAAVALPSRKRTMVLMGGANQTLGDVQNLLLLEVPRMQLEVIPLWQRTVELLPGLQSQLEALQANRAAYVAMLQSITAAGPGASSAQGAGAANGAAGAAGGAGHGALLAGMGGVSQRGSNASGRSSLHRGATGSGAGLGGGPAPPRRFISMKYRGPPSTRAGGLGVVPSGDSIDEGGGPGVGGGRGGRAFVRASSSRSYAGRNTGEDDDADASSGAEHVGQSAERGAEGSPAVAAVARGSAGPRRGGGSPATRLLSSRRGAGHSPSSTGALSGLPEGEAAGTRSGSRTSGSVKFVVGVVGGDARAGSAGAFRLGPPGLGSVDGEPAPTGASGGGSGFGGPEAVAPRRSSITNRLNNLFSAISFRVDGRFNRYHLSPGSASDVAPAAGTGAYGGYAHPPTSPAQPAGIASPQRSPPPPPPGGIAVDLPHGELGAGHGDGDLQSVPTLGGPSSPRGASTGGGDFGSSLLALASRRMSAGVVAPGSSSRPGSQTLAPPFNLEAGGGGGAAAAAALQAGSGQPQHGLSRATSARKKGPKMGLLQRISTLTARLPFGGDRSDRSPSQGPAGAGVGSRSSTPVRSSPAVSEGGSTPLQLPLDHSSPPPQHPHRLSPAYVTPQAVPPKRPPVPTAALALVHEHAQQAAAAAAAAAALAAANSAAAAAESEDTSRDRSTGRSRRPGGSARSSFPDLESLPSGSALSLAGGLGGGLLHGSGLAPVAELTNSGRGSSAAGLGTPRTGSAATHRTTSSDPPSQAMGFPRGPPGTITVAAGSPAAAASPISRFAPLAPALASPVAGAPPPLAVQQLQDANGPVDSRAPSLGALGPSGSMLPQRAMYLADGSLAPVLSNIIAGSGGSGGGASPAVPPRGRFDVPLSPDIAGAETAGAPARAPASTRSKGMWLGLRLATDALRSVSRGADSGKGDGSNTGSEIQPGEAESPSLPAPPQQSSAAGRWPSLSSAGGAAFPAGLPGSAAGSRNTSRLATPVASWRRGAVTAAGLPVGVGGVASLQAVIDMAEAALAGSTGAAYSGSRERRSSLGGSGMGLGLGGSSASPSRNQSLRRPATAAVAVATITPAGASTGARGGVADGGSLQQRQLDTAGGDESVRTSAPLAPSRFSLRRGTGSMVRGGPMVQPTLAQLPPDED